MGQARRTGSPKRVIGISNPGREHGHAGWPPEYIEETANNLEEEMVG
jgi:hypothetical protein